MRSKEKNGEKKGKEGGMNERTMKELVTEAQRYDNIHNEGCEGYNPYRAEMERRAFEAEKARPRDKHDVISDLHRFDCSLARECGTYDEEKVSALRAELAEMEEAEEAEFAAEWTKEITTERRAMWNAWVKASGRPDPWAVCAKQKEQGYKLDDIRRAMKLHGLE